MSGGKRRTYDSSRVVQEQHNGGGAVYLDDEDYNDVSRPTNTRTISSLGGLNGDHIMDHDDEEGEGTGVRCSFGGGGGASKHESKNFEHGMIDDDDDDEKEDVWSSAGRIIMGCGCIAVIAVAAFGFAILRANNNNDNSMPPLEDCGCATCTADVLNANTTLTDSNNLFQSVMTCGEWIDYIRHMDPHYPTEEAACSYVASQSTVCGPACDPLQCHLDENGDPTEDRSRLNLVELTPDFPIYCFPHYQDRTRYNNIWSDNYVVEVKETQTEGEFCGPGDNKFSTETVSVERAATTTSGRDEITLQFKQVNGQWTGSEVRVVKPTNQDPFHYGNYQFSVKSVSWTDANGVPRSDNFLPPSLILGLFTWDATERFDVRENYGHEVDVEISRWGIPDSPTDANFVVQPPEIPQWFNFSTAPGPNANFSQGGNTYEFTWIPGKVSWETTAGGGVTFEYTTEQAVALGVEDRIQCMPADVEIRLNVWNLHSVAQPMEMQEGDVVTVVIDNFLYTPSDVAPFLSNGETCSKDCQCVERSYCNKDTHRCTRS